MSDEEPVTKRHKGDGDSASRGEERPDMEELEEQERGDSPVVGPGGSQHAERVVTDHYSNPEGNDEPDGTTYTIAEKKAPPPEELVKKLHSYEMNHLQRGTCLVFNNETFDPTLDLNPRDGSSVDAEKLKEAFEGLDFSVEVLKDQDTTGIRKKLRKAARDVDHSQSDCFVCVFLTHGENGMIYGYNGEVSIKKLTDLFRGDNCPTLKGKPKLFFIQACRGANRERPVEPLDSPGGDGQDEPMDVMDAPDVDTGVRPTLPAGADFLMAYSTSEGFSSYRDTVRGTWYIQDLCLALKKHGTTMEIQQILTLVNYIVSHREVERSKKKSALGTKQMPCVLSMLTKKLIFTKKLNTSHVPV